MQVAADHGVSHVDTGMAGEGGQALFRKGSEPAVVHRFSTIMQGRPRAGHRSARGGRRGRRVDRELERSLGTWGDGGATSWCSSRAPTRHWPNGGAAWQRLRAYRGCR